MLYAAHTFQRAFLDAVAPAADWIARANLPWVSAQSALLHRMAKRYPKPLFAIPGAVEEIVETRPFVKLLRFVPDGGARGPKVLVVAPLSGHHATLVRDTITALLADHDVFVTDWLDARNVPLSAGTFSLEDYIAEVRHFLARLDAAQVHVVAVCQPTVPVLAAIALDAAAGRATPRSLTLMGGPIDARRAPTVVNKLATDHSIRWFEMMMIHRVPAGFAGVGRRVYPGFLQLQAFLMMNPERHAKAHADYVLAQLRGDTAATTQHEAFYDEYNAVLDMDAPYYLETVKTVFQEFSLARGTWRVGGTLVEPAAITATPIFTIEGELDDISGPGQTAAALELCTSLGADQKRHHTAPGCGHYGLFSGRRWRTDIYPLVREQIARVEAAS